MTSFALRLIPEGELARHPAPCLPRGDGVRIHEFRGRECTHPDATVKRKNDHARKRKEDTEYVAPRRLPSALSLHPLERRQ